MFHGCKYIILNKNIRHGWYKVQLEFLLVETPIKEILVLLWGPKSIKLGTTGRILKRKIKLCTDWSSQQEYETFFIVMKTWLTKEKCIFLTVSPYMLKLWIRDSTTSFI